MRIEPFHVATIITRTNIKHFHNNKSKGRAFWEKITRHRRIPALINHIWMDGMDWNINIEYCPLSEWVQCIGIHLAKCILHCNGSSMRATVVFSGFSMQSNWLRKPLFKCIHRPALSPDEHSSHCCGEKAWWASEYRQRCQHHQHNWFSLFCRMFKPIQPKFLNGGN